MMKTEYTEDCGFMQRDSVEHEEYVMRAQQLKSVVILMQVNTFEL